MVGDRLGCFMYIAVAGGYSLLANQATFGCIGNLSAIFLLPCGQCLTSFLDRSLWRFPFANVYKLDQQCGG